jgi:hypothetical protein|tara:strand:- start:21242 stop:21511 length:270 start_codon:yes stop_codon:yes gene_type:complete
MGKKIVRLTENDLSKVVSKLVEQQMGREFVLPEIPTPEIEVSGGFTDRDRKMLRAIFDTVVGGGASVGGYRGGRKRALPRLGDFGGSNE